MLSRQPGTPKSKIVWNPAVELPFPQTSTRAFSHSKVVMRWSKLLINPNFLSRIAAGSSRSPVNLLEMR